jgi:hypothetical protein
MTLADLEVQTADGAVSRPFADLERPTLVVLVRYYG